VGGREAQFARDQRREGSTGRFGAARRRRACSAFAARRRSGSCKASPPTTGGARGSDVESVARASEAARCDVPGREPLRSDAGPQLAVEAQWA
jgi:hypothetical protein